jgi:hypothetical protein
MIAARLREVDISRINKTCLVSPPVHITGDDGRTRVH